jgi:hypothetical protein
LISAERFSEDETAPDSWSVLDYPGPSLSKLGFLYRKRRIAIILTHTHKTLLTAGPHSTSLRQALHFAPPDFLRNLVVLANFMRLSLRKAAHAALSSGAWQEIRVRSGRDDNFFFGTRIPYEI